MEPQTLEDLCGHGINYFDLEDVGYVKTAMEVSGENLALMRNIRRHGHVGPRGHPMPPAPRCRPYAPTEPVTSGSHTPPPPAGERDEAAHPP